MTNTISHADLRLQPPPKKADQKREVKDLRARLMAVSARKKRNEYLTLSQDESNHPAEI